MARRKKLKIEDFPAPGSIFLMPLADGRFGICRVLRLGVEENGHPKALVTASDWIGHTPPALDDPATKRTLTLTHHTWSGKPERIWVFEPPPKTFKKLGEIRLSRTESTAECSSYSAWETLALQVLLQWRWDHDREAVLREDAQIEIAKQKRNAKAAADREKYLANISLPLLLSKNLFPTWIDYPKPKDKRTIEQIIKTFITILAATKGPLASNFVARELKTCVEKLNAFDGSRYVIETVEREDLFDVFEEILHAAKHPSLLSVVDDVREW